MVCFRGICCCQCADDHGPELWPLHCHPPPGQVPSHLHHESCQEGLDSDLARLNQHHDPTGHRQATQRATDRPALQSGHIDLLPRTLAWFTCQTHLWCRTLFLYLRVPRDTCDIFLLNDRLPFVDRELCPAASRFRHPSKLQSGIEPETGGSDAAAPCSAICCVMATLLHHHSLHGLRTGGS